MPSAQASTKDYISADGDFQERYTCETTNKAEIRLEEQSEKVETRQENL